MACVTPGVGFLDVAFFFPASCSGMPRTLVIDDQKLLAPTLANASRPGGAKRHVTASHLWHTSFNNLSRDWNQNARKESLLHNVIAEISNKNRHSVLPCRAAATSPRPPLIVEFGDGSSNYQQSPSSAWRPLSLQLTQMKSRYLSLTITFFS